ncbi:unnamed protein product, partial [Polarella glacialis]
MHGAARGVIQLAAEGSPQAFSASAFFGFPSLPRGNESVKQFRLMHWHCILRTDVQYVFLFSMASSRGLFSESAPVWRIREACVSVCC